MNFVSSNFEIQIDEFCAKYFPKSKLVASDESSDSSETSTEQESSEIYMDSNILANSQPQDKVPTNLPSKLFIFDFDATLFRSPLPNPDLWSTKFVNSLVGDCGWFVEPRTLASPQIPETPDASWFDEKILDIAGGIMRKRKQENEASKIY
ncbi:hypothetical protein HK096_009196 [Nowakowskiella sp. JEL0078]|nr:hypothetical protein HK096_009196 [Nowakowskiella sp. JEL0078]